MTKVIKNITESSQFRASQLASNDLKDEERKAIADYNQLLSKGIFTSLVTEEEITGELYADEAKYTEKLAEYKARVIEVMPDWLKNDCKNFGVELPSDLVFLKVRLGNVLFDMYRQSAPIPQAPLAQALYMKKNSEYAEELDKDEFTMPTDISKFAEKILTDDKLWETVQVSAWIDIPAENNEEPKKFYMTLRNSGLMQYREILGGLLGAFLPNEPKKNSTKVNKTSSAEAQ